MRLCEWWSLTNDKSSRIEGFFPSWDKAKIHAVRLGLEAFTIVRGEVEWTPYSPLPSSQDALASSPASSLEDCSNQGVKSAKG